MYLIKKASEDFKACFCSDEWAKAKVATIDKKNWDCFDYTPKSEARILYNSKGLYVLLSTFDEHMLARYTKQNSAVCMDSCMEFFLRPNESDPRYINLEINAFGTMYLGIRTGRADPVFPTEDKKYFGIKSKVDESGWKLMYHIPFEFIDKTFGGHTDTMYANIYKCREDGENPHWMTYAPIKTEKPDYHRPEFFAEFRLEK